MKVELVVVIEKKLNDHYYDKVGVQKQGTEKTLASKINKLYKLQHTKWPADWHRVLKTVT